MKNASKFEFPRFEKFCLQSLRRQSAQFEIYRNHFSSFSCFLILPLFKIVFFCETSFGVCLYLSSFVPPFQQTYPSLYILFCARSENTPRLTTDALVDQSRGVGAFLDPSPIRIVLFVLSKSTSRWIHRNRRVLHTISSQMT